MTFEPWPGTVCRFDQVPFRRVVDRVERAVPAGAAIVTAYTNGQVTLRSNRRLDGYHEAADLSGFQGVIPGDFVVHGLDILRGSVGVSDSSGALSNVCNVCRPRRGDARYYAYAIRAQAAAGFIRAMARGVREGGADFRRWDTLGELPLPVPPERQQRAIADFLDAETARIDALIAKKRRLVVAAANRLCTAISDSFTFGSGPMLRRYVAAVGGSWGANAGEDDVEARCIRGTDFEIETLTCDGTSAPVRSYPLADVARRALSPNDLVIEKSGGGDKNPVGRAVLYTGTGLALPTNFAARLRPLPGMDPAYLVYLFRAAYERRLTRAWVKQTTGIQNLDLEGLLSERCAVPSLAEQRKVADRLSGDHEWVVRLTRAVERQIELLLEHRQALVTAAVTGELDIPGVAA